MTVANNTRLCSTISVVFLEFILVDRAEISHMNTSQNLSRLPGSYEEALNVLQYTVSIKRFMEIVIGWTSDHANLEKFKVK